MPRGGAWLLLGLVDRVEIIEPVTGEIPRIDVASLRRGMHELDEPGEILLPFPRPEVDAEPAGVDRFAPGQQTRLIDRHPRGGDGEQGIAAVLGPPVGVGDVVASRKSFASAAILVAKLDGVEQADRPDAALPSLERGPGRLQVAARPA